MLVVKTHLNSKFDQAVANICESGRKLAVTEEQRLRLILSHWCGWSPTDVNHHHDSWVKYLQAEYAHLGQLYPILDSLTWEDELQLYPRGRIPPQPSLFLLATVYLYYVYDFENMCMCRAGQSLEEVYEGLKRMRYCGIEEGDWEEEEPGIEGNPASYFPVYVPNRNHGFVVETPQEEFSIGESELVR